MFQIVGPESETIPQCPYRSDYVQIPFWVVNGNLHAVHGCFRYSVHKRTLPDVFLIEARFGLKQNWWQILIGFLCCHSDAKTAPGMAMISALRSIS